VRQALDFLAKEKLIERFRAKGTFVTHHPEEQMWCEVETGLAYGAFCRRAISAPGMGRRH
jgi:DNA-binding FadR family transcriptional regulator